MDIQVNSLTKIYGPQKAIDEISFEVKTGEILGFLGPNGAGKTTTMKILACYMAPSSGGAKMGTFDLLSEAKAIKPKIGYLPENNPLYLDMPVMEYLEYMAGLQSVPKADVPARLRNVVQLCGLNKEKHKVIKELSKGYRQRVGLAQALIHDPEILILDEPTTGLDPNQIIEIRNLIKQIGKEKTVILSTHILPEVEATCDRILIINQGKIVADGTPESLRNRAKGDQILDIEILAPADIDLFTALKEANEITMVDPQTGKGRFHVTFSEGTSGQETIFNFCVDKGWTLVRLTPIETKLEDIFRDLTLS